MGATLAFVAIVVVHLHHAAVLGGRHRLWHAGHVLMALGMVVMFVPVGGGMVVPAELGVAVFVVATAAEVVALVVARVRGVGLGPLWFLGVADLAWMVWMFAAISSAVSWLSVVGVV